MNRAELEEFADELMIGDGMFEPSDFLPIGMSFCRRCGEAVLDDHLHTDSGDCITCEDATENEYDTW